MKKGISRRTFLVGASSFLILPGLAARASERCGRELSFLHTHTGERLKVEYHDGQNYLSDALDEINYFLRDFRTGDIHPIDPGVLDILWELKKVTGQYHRSYQIISAYRSPKTNAMLRARSSGVAKRSLHMQGKAIDVRLERVGTKRLYKAALSLRKGGVGCYSKSRFVHLDTGRVRTWGS